MKFNIFQPNLFYIGAAFLLALLFSIAPVRDSIIEMLDTTLPYLLWAATALLTFSYAISYQKAKSRSMQRRSAQAGGMTVQEYFILAMPVLILGAIAFAISIVVSYTAPLWLEKNPWAPLLWLLPLMIFLLYWLKRRSE